MSHPVGSRGIALGGRIGLLAIAACAVIGEVDDPGKVNIGDIEERLRLLGASAKDAVVASKRNAIASGLLGGLLTITAAYLHGRRRGRRRATVLEIERQ